jgi:hypothetical protein
LPPCSVSDFSLQLHPHSAPVGTGRGCSNNTDQTVRWDLGGDLEGTWRRGGLDWREEERRGAGDDMRGRLAILNELDGTEDEEEGRRKGGRKCIGLDKMMETTTMKMGTS